MNPFGHWNALEAIEQRLTAQEVQRLSFVRSQRDAAKWLEAQHHAGLLPALATMQQAKRLAFGSFLYTSGRVNEGAES